MAIAKMKKFTLLALESHKEKLLEYLQQFQMVEFINLQNEKSENLEFMDNDSQSEIVSELEGKKAKIKFSLDILNRYVEKEKGLKAMMKDKKSIEYSKLKKLGEKVDFNSIYDYLKEKDTKLSFLKNEISKPKSDIEVLKPWVNFDTNFEDTKLKNCVSYLGTIPLKEKDKFREEIDSNIKSSYVEFVNETEKDVYMFVIVHNDFKEELSQMLKKYGFNKLDIKCQSTPRGQIESLYKDIKDIKDKQKNVEEEMREYVNKIEELEIAYEYLTLEISKGNACYNFKKSDKVVAIEGWVPKDFKDKFEKIVKQSEGKYYYLEFEDPTEEEVEEVPIMLKNNGVVSAFESITSMYSLPKYNEIDPTPLLFPFYIIFFGMMLSDAGYGLVMVLATTIALKMIPFDDEMKKMVKLFCYLGISTMVWGVLYGSYFTGALKIPAIWMKPENNANLLIIVSIVFGLIQIYAGLFIKAYMLIRDKKYMDAVYDVLLWIITVTSAILFIVSAFQDIPALKANVNLFKYLMIAGMVGLVLTQGRESKSIGGKLGGGLYGLYGITGYVGDMVSYTRLMALGLATGFIGGAFNSIVALLGSGVIAIIVGAVLFLLTHTFNLLINALGAYVHSLRLQYVEYFGKFYEGGGRAFAPFRHKNKFIKVKTDLGGIDNE